jgi:hypothetical protein
VQKKRHPPPAAADVEHPLTGLERKLRSDMRFLVELRLLQRLVIGVGPIGAAILLVVVEEEFVKLVAEVVMMSDVPSCSLQVVRQEQPLERLRRLSL